MRTWICFIYGGGTPIYLVSAKDETAAMKLIYTKLNERYGSFDEKNCSRLVALDGWLSDTERIVDIWGLHC